MNGREMEGKRRYCFQLSEYLQIACTGRHSLTLVVSENGEPLGKISLEKGVLLNAFDREGKGEDAFRRLILNKKAEADLLELEADEKETNIHVDCEELIFRIFTTKDRDGAFPVRKKNPQKEKPPYMDRMNRGLGMILDRDFKTAQLVFKEIDKENPGDKCVTAILKRLKEII